MFMSLALWVIILNWNQKQLTADCLKSLLQGPCEPSVKVLVVDNGSVDGSPEYLREGFPGIDLLVNDNNLGFSGGNNVGIRYALDHGADLILLLNNDTEVSPGCMRALMEAARSHGQYGFFGSKIYYYDRPGILWYAGGDIRLGLPMGVHARINTVDDSRVDRVEGASFVTGCALLMRREAVESVGLLDESLFAYAEDLDWCIRAQRAGYGGGYVPGARLWHKVGKSLSGKPGESIRTYLYARNRFVLQKRYTSTLETFLLIPLYLVCNIARHAYSAVFKGDIRQTAALFLGILDGIRGKQCRYRPAGSSPGLLRSL
jgi:hypothetical protein